MSHETKSVKDFFAKSNITLCDEWLESCINWYKQENEGTSYTLEELQTQVYKQWLLLDFRDITVPILPANIRNEVKCVLNKVICLQLMSVVDISKPKFSQLLKLRNVIALSHHDEIAKSKRVLQLTLTDGVQDILATEIKPIACLSLNLTPGLKIRLNTPITIRSGQIMLEPNSIKILGGEVEELLISNAAENILAAVLSLPLNEHPFALQEHFDDSVHIIQSVPNRIPVQVPVQLNPTDPFADDIDFEAVDFESIDKIATQIDAKIEPKSQPETQLHDGIDPDELEEMMRLEDEMKQEEKLQTRQQVESTTIKSSLSTSRPVMTIERLLGMKHSVNKGKFVIHAKFVDIIKKLVINNEEFLIKIVVEDITGEIDVNLHTIVVSNLLGYDPKAMNLLKERARNKDIVAKNTFIEKINNFKERLTNLNSKMDVLIETGLEPTVVHIYD